MTRKIPRITSEASVGLGQDRGEHSKMPRTFLRLPTVRGRTGMSRSSIYAGVAAGTFPRPIKLAARSVAWLESDVDRWITQRIQMAVRHKPNEAPRSIGTFS
jgi:prophage regulatory protein